MGRVRASVDVAVRASDAERLWYDTRRWPAFVDGLEHVSHVDAGWPAEPGARVVWDSRQGGRGRVTEVVETHEARTGQTASVRDHAVRGTQTVRFVPHDDGVRVELELEYAIEGPGPRGPWTPVVDLLFVRRAMREALERTLTRFAREVEADREPVR